MMKEMWPMDTFLNETNITDILSFVVVDLATNGTFEVGFFDLLHEVYVGFSPFEWLMLYNITPIAYNDTLYSWNFDVSNFSITDELNRIGLHHLFLKELDDPNHDTDSFDFAQFFVDFHGDNPLNQTNWTFEYMWVTVIDAINLEYAR